MNKYPDDDYWEPRDPNKQYDVGVFEADYTGTARKYRWKQIEYDMIAEEEVSQEELEELAPYCCCQLCELEEQSRAPNVGWIEWVQKRTKSIIGCRDCNRCIASGFLGLYSAGNIKKARKKRFDAINK